MNTLPLIVIGAGGHAKVVLDALQSSGRRILGAVDSDPKLKGQHILGFEILGDDRILSEHVPAEVELANGLGSTASTGSRQAIFDRLHGQGYAFATVVHPSAVVSKHAKIGMGAQVMAGAIIQAGAIIGRNSIVNTGAQIDHDSVIGDHVHIAPGAVLSGQVTVGSGTHIGAGACIIQGVTIGENATIGAGSLVLKRLPDNCLAFGTPAKIQG